MTSEPTLVALSPGAVRISPLPSGEGSHHRQMTSPGFWNELPIDEERIPLPPMKPTYGRKEQRMEYSVLSWLNLYELTLFLCLTYSAIACTRLGIFLMNWMH